MAEKIIFFSERKLKFFLKNLLVQKVLSASIKVFWRAKGFSSLPGGNQVDGLPPAASTDWSWAGTRVTTDLFINFVRFF